MVFSNVVFLFLFLPITLVIYYLPVLKTLIVFRNIWLFLVSLAFYAWGEPIYVLLMILSITANYYFGLLVEKYNAKTSGLKTGKKIVALSCIFNLGILFIFKYLSWILSMFGIVALKGLALPIGISFYTFQALSYVIDVYRGKNEAQKSIINVGLYISFFPQLIAGPIVRYGSIAEQLKNRVHSFDKFSQGVWRFCIGLAKKVLIANHVAQLVDLAFSLASSRPGYGYAVGGGAIHTSAELSVALAWAGAIGFMLQIYFDFSGYSDMAIGLGKMFGFEFNENFNYPYVAKSVSEYWRRWHISLGEWFRDYLYYPLSLGPAIKIRKKALDKGYSRKAAGVISTGFVLFIVWMSTGIWHGANMTFVFWGLIQFVFIFWEQYRKPMENKMLGTTLGFISTFLIVLVTKVMFKSESIWAAFRYYEAMLHLNGNVLWDNLAAYWIGQYKVSLIAGMIFIFPVVEKINSMIERSEDRSDPRLRHPYLILCVMWKAFKFIFMIMLFIMSVSYVIGGGYNPFIYFNF